MRPIAFATDDKAFVRCLPWTLVEEGGNSDDPHDPGGATHEGITQREYDAYRRLKDLPLQSVFRATDAEVDEIYYTSYWQPWCPILVAGIDMVFFDNAVNEGPARAIILLQRSLGVSADGHIGIITRSALKEQTIDQDHTLQLLEKYETVRESYYKSLANFQYFGEDWLARAERITTAAKGMVV